jgi:hypothetical protein
MDHPVILYRPDPELCPVRAAAEVLKAAMPAAGHRGRCSYA